MRESIHLSSLAAVQKNIFASFEKRVHNFPCPGLGFQIDLVARIKV
jgi:hypothetical protein